jgi:hypothetical protein
MRPSTRAERVSSVENTMLSKSAGSATRRAKRP